MKQAGAEQGHTRVWLGWGWDGVWMGLRLVSGWVEFDLELGWGDKYQEHCNATLGGTRKAAWAITNIS